MEGKVKIEIDDIDDYKLVHVIWLMQESIGDVIKVKNRLKSRELWDDPFDGESMLDLINSDRIDEVVFYVQEHFPYKEKK